MNLDGSLEWLQGVKGEIRLHEQLSRHTSLRVGGSADTFIIPEDRTEAVEVIRRSIARGIPLVVIGGGSNLLVRDGGIRGAVLSLNRLNSIRMTEPGLVRAEAGVSNGALVRYAADRGLAGLEFIVGIPGTVGGALAVNAGAHGSAVCELVERMDTCVNGYEGEKTRDNLHYGYRYLDLLPGEVILSATFRLQSESRSDIDSRISGYRKHRSTNQQVIFPNAGCWFRNPEGIQAWRLIEAAGMRGARKGGAEVSVVHCNFLVNRGGATARDFLELAREIKEKVQRQSGVLLEEEVRIVGEG